MATKAKKKTYSVNIEYTVTLYGTIDIRAESEEDAERIANEKMPKVEYQTPDGWDANEDISVEVLDT